MPTRSPPLTRAFAPVSVLVAAKEMPADSSAWSVGVPPGHVISAVARLRLANMPLSCARQSGSSGPLNPSGPIRTACASTDAGGASSAASARTKTESASFIPSPQTALPLVEIVREALQIGRRLLTADHVGVLHVHVEK